MGVRYASVEDVRAAMDTKTSARDTARIMRALESASRAVDTLCARRFYPTATTRYFDWPNVQRARPWRLWLGADEIISITTLTVADETIAAADYFLEPANSGPPYDRIEIDLSSTAAWSSGDTHQRSIAVTGVFGHGAGTEGAGATAEALDASETGVDVTDSSLIGAGDTILVDSEYMLVTGRSMADTGVNIATGGGMTASAADVTLACDTATGIPSVGETVLVGSERMLIVDAAGTSLTVQRAYDGTVLAAHDAAASVWAPRTLTVTRGELGTTAATHDTATAVARHAPPGLVRDLTIAHAIVRLEQESAGYARTVGAGETSRNASLAGLRDLEEQVMAAYGRVGSP